MSDEDQLRQVAKARDADGLMEAALVKVASENDVTYGELLMAACRLREQMSPSRGLDARTILGLITLVIVCATIVTITYIITH